MKAYPTELITACKMVVEAFPEVDHLYVSLNGRWLFCDDSYESPTFDGEVDISVLEDMVDSLDNANFGFPAAFYIPEVLR